MPTSATWHVHRLRHRRSLLQSRHRPTPQTLRHALEQPGRHRPSSPCAASTRQRALAADLDTAAQPDRHRVTRHATRSITITYKSDAHPESCRWRGGLGGGCQQVGMAERARLQRGKRLRRTVVGIPTRQFGNRLTARAARRGVAVIGVDAAYTSKWTQPLQQRASDPATVTRHHGAAAAIGRRGLALAIRRRPAGPRTGQRTAAGTPPATPNRSSSHGGRRGSSGPPTRPRGVPVHRTTPAASGQHRSGRSRAGPTPAH
jgi:hypothetical protein